MNVSQSTGGRYCRYLSCTLTYRVFGLLGFLNCAIVCSSRRDWSALDEFRNGSDSGPELINGVKGSMGNKLTSYWGNHYSTRQTGLSSTFDTLEGLGTSMAQSCTLFIPSAA